MDKKTVLIVDDEPTIRTIVRIVMTRAGLEPIECASADKALEVLSTLASPLKCIVTDRSMPGMNGDAFVRELRQRGCWAPVIMMTGDSFLPKEIYGVNVVLRKPFDPDDLRRAMRDAETARPQGT